MEGIVNFSTVATTAGLVNNALSVLKSARDLAKDTSDNELKEKIGAAYEALLDLREHALAQDDEIRKLKAQLEDKATYIGPLPPHGYYYAANDAEAQQHPLCQTCFQSKPQKIGFMDDAKSWSGGVRRECKLCQETVWEKPMDTATVTRVARQRGRY